jgi:hypothetical protein
MYPHRKVITVVEMAQEAHLLVAAAGGLARLEELP